MGVVGRGGYMRGFSAVERRWKGRGSRDIFVVQSGRLFSSNSIGVKSFFPGVTYPYSHGTKV